MAKAPLKIGVAGVGFGALVHIPAFQSEGLEVVAVSASRMERAQAAADKFAIPHAFNDFAAMLALPDIEAVSIATPTGTHLEMVSQALAAGKHVLCEKAFARNADEARQMRDLATATNLTCMVAHEFRFAAPRALAKEMIDAGYVGTPKFVRASMALNGPGPTAKPAKPPPYSPTRDNASQGGGILFSIGSHYIDGLIHWLGRVATVSATLTNLWPERLDGDRAVLSDADNLYLLHLTFENGTIAELTGSMSLPFGKAATIELFGTEGTLATPQGDYWNALSRGPLLGAKRGDADLKPLDMPERLAPFIDERDDRLMAFRLMTRAFLHGIETGTSPSPNFEDAYHTQQVLDAARTSSAQGVRVTIGA
jgi:predicted dehydrogenase